MKFTHLHVHSHYSLLDGLAKIDDLVARAKTLGMESLALTDHGTLYGAVEFFQKAKKAGIKPIIGCEIYLTNNKMAEKRPDDKRFHLTLLVKDKTGYNNLVQLITKAHLEGFYYKPRVDKNCIKEHAEGLICLSGCSNAEIPHLIYSNQQEAAKNAALEYQDIFGKENFYIELQPHMELDRSKKIYPKLLALARELEIPTVATNDAHYLLKEDDDYQDVLLAIGTGNKVSDQNRLTMKGADLSLKSVEEMIELFKDIPEAIENTQKIADACNFEFEFGTMQLPHFELPEGKTTEGYLEELARDGLKRLFGYTLEEAPEVIRERFLFELSVIKRTGFPSYILIVQDFVNWAKERGIVVGPGRGSAAGSLISYLIGVTNIDPIKYNLLFERFLNPDRIAPPDIDLDFADHRRDEVIEYVAQKYGRDHVAQIITFGTMAARAAVRDSGRALGFGYTFCDRIAKMIPFAVGMTFAKALGISDELKQAMDTDPQARQLIQTAQKLEGVARHASTHACGVVITKNPITHYMPIQWAAQSNARAKGRGQALVTQYDMKAVEALGLLKMDFLGLRNLTIIEKALELIEKNYGRKIDIYNIPLDDKKVFELLARADTTGVFQFESKGMRRYLKELKPTELEDLIVMVAAFRPGPMEFIPTYIARKNGKERVNYLHPKLAPILESTYGVAIYQEQVLKIANQLAGFTIGEADILRKAVGKKIKKLLDEQREKMIVGMINNGIEKTTSEKIWDFIEPFARYGFNRCLTGDTKIVDPESGLLVTIEDLYTSKRQPKILSLEPTLKIKPHRVTEVYNNGKKPVWSIITKSGRSIKATANHPFLTPHDWEILENIHLGEKIAVPRLIPEPRTPIKVEDHKLAVLGYLLAEGNFCHPNSFYFYSKADDEIQDYLYWLEHFDNTTGKIDKSKSTAAVYTKREDIKKRSEAVTWIESLGLKYKKATEKFFPELVYRLNNRGLALLIGKMFQGDGCINLKRDDPQIFYATSSPLIAEGLQHLLLRFGILSTIHKKQFKYRGNIKVGYTATISRYDNIQKFVQVFKEHLVGQKVEAVNKIPALHPILSGRIPQWAARGSFDIVPTTMARGLVREAIASAGFNIAGFTRTTGISERLFYRDDRKIGYLRETLALIAEKTASENLMSVAQSDIYWDEIKEINYIGIEDTFDLTVDETHNFVANDIIVHNSHAACYALIAYQTAYLKTSYPAEFMAALLNAESFDIERVAVLIEEAKRMDIEVLPPDINESYEDFTLVKDNTGTRIRFGLAAVKNLGENAVLAVIGQKEKNGKFTDLRNMLERIPAKDLNKKSLESLIKCGALDAFGDRKTLYDNTEEMLKYSRDWSRARESTQIGLFGAMVNVAPLKIRETQPITKQEKLSWEKELLGLYISDHPLKEYKDLLEKKAILINNIKSALDGRKVSVGGIIAGIQKIVTKTGQLMLFTRLEDWTSQIEVVVFPAVLEKNPNIWQENNMVIVEGRVSNRDGNLKILCDTVQELKT